jgi:hypothetical protein
VVMPSVKIPSIIVAKKCYKDVKHASLFCLKEMLQNIASTSCYCI